MKREDLKALLADMSLQEKIDQMLQIMGGFFLEDAKAVLTGPKAQLGITDEDISMAGSILGTYGAEQLIDIQKKYMEKQPHHIPMLFMLDVIHGMKTVFPMPLALGATFDPELSGECASAAAKEAAVSGLHVTFSPMVDLVRDARWGRVMESTGEDTYLNGLFAAEQVKGFQGDDMSQPGKICACIKHFAAYGGAQAGRDYHTVQLTEHTLREDYLPAYEAGIKAGVGMVMTSFNTVNDIPASGNKWLMRNVLREEMGFDGVLISDFSAIRETIDHGYAADEADAAAKSLEAGVDIDMMTGCYAANLKRLVEEGKVDESLIDESVLRILELKNKLGLFENPYKDADPQAEKEIILCDEHRALARKAANESFVLLKNEGLLPLDLSKKIAFIGPYTDNKEIISSWSIAGNTNDCVTIKEAAEEIFDLNKTAFCQGCTILSPEYKLVGFDGMYQKETGPEEKPDLAKLLAEAIAAAKEADLVVLPLGEHYLQSGEATSRAMIEVPEIQMNLLREVAKVNENIVVILFNGRPLDLREITGLAKSVLEVWIPGTEGGHAIIDTLTGKNNPSGKLPMTFPYCVGQIPVHYNQFSTGRPNLPGMQERFRSKYIDIPNEPLYPFGYGQSYTSFEISPVTLSSPELTAGETITAKATIKNTGNISGTEVIQLYLQDVTASVVRPVRELKGLKRVTLEPKQELEVSFTIDEPMLRFLKENGKFESEAGLFRIWIGNNSQTENMAEFNLN